jgi:hypothetical protein
LPIVLKQQAKRSTQCAACSNSGDCTFGSLSVLLVSAIAAAFLIGKATVWSAFSGALTIDAFFQSRLFEVVGKMKIEVDAKGWNLVKDAADSSVKPISGVYAKATSSSADAELAQAQTEPSPPSDEAVAQAGLRMPSPPIMPKDLSASDDDSLRLRPPGTQVA